MAITGKEPLDDTLAHLQTTLSAAQAGEVRQPVQGFGPVVRDALSPEISLGCGGDTGESCAKLALILLPHLFITKQALKQRELLRVKTFSPNGDDCSQFQDGGEREVGSVEAKRRGHQVQRVSAVRYRFGAPLHRCQCSALPVQPSKKQKNPAAS